MRDYFITGGTGAVGSALVPELLADPQTRVTLLVRAGSPQQLSERLDALFRFWRFGEGEADARARVGAVAGDATLPGFGIAPEAYAALARRCTHVVHAAGSVRMNLPIDEARASSLGSARNVVAFARRCAADHAFGKVEFVSTVGVAGRRPGILPEQWLTEPRAFHNTYEQAKAEAEDWLRSELDADPLPVTVHRPSMVVGDSRTGRIIHFQVFYHLCEFLSGSRTRGLSPALLDARLDTVPADYVARLIAWSSRTPETAGRVLHSCSGPEGAIPLAELRSRVRRRFAESGRALPPVRELPRGLFRAALLPLQAFAPGKARKAIATLPVFLDYLAENQAFANAATAALARRGGIELPPAGDYLDRVLAYYLAQRTARRETGSAE